MFALVFQFERMKSSHCVLLLTAKQSDLNAKCTLLCVCGVCVLERITEVLMEDEESEEELGAGVRAAFNGFKTQLRAHFSVSTKTPVFLLPTLLALVLPPRINEIFSR